MTRYKVHKMRADGNCFFRAIAQAIWTGDGRPLAEESLEDTLASFARKSVAEYILANPEVMRSDAFRCSEEFGTSSPNNPHDVSTNVLKRCAEDESRHVARDEVWAEMPAIIAAADVYGAVIRVYDKTGTTYQYEIRPFEYTRKNGKRARGERTICLAHDPTKNEEHFNLMLPSPTTTTQHAQGRARIERT